MSDPLGARGALRLLANPAPLPAPLLEAMLEHLPTYHLRRLADRPDLPDDLVERLLERAQAAGSPTFGEVLAARVKHSDGDTLMGLVHTAASSWSLIDREHAAIASGLSLTKTAHLLQCADPLAVTYVLANSRQVTDADRVPAIVHTHELLDATTEHDWPWPHYEKAMGAHVSAVLGDVQIQAVRELVLSSTNIDFLTGLFFEAAHWGQAREDLDVVAHMARHVMIPALALDGYGHRHDSSLLHAMREYGDALPLDVLDTVASDPRASADVAEAAAALADTIRTERTDPVATQPEARERDEQFAARFLAQITTTTTPDTSTWSSILTLLSELDPATTSADAATTVTTVLA